VFPDEVAPFMLAYRKTEKTAIRCFVVVVHPYSLSLSSPLVLLFDIAFR